MKNTLFIEMNQMYHLIHQSAGSNPDDQKKRQPTMIRNEPRTFQENIEFSSSSENEHYDEDQQGPTILSSSLSSPLDSVLSPPPPPPTPPPPPSSSVRCSKNYERIPITLDLLKTVQLQSSVGSPKKIKKPIGMCTSSTAGQMKNI